MTKFKLPKLSHRPHPITYEVKVGKEIQVYELVSENELWSYYQLVYVI